MFSKLVAASLLLAMPASLVFAAEPEGPRGPLFAVERLGKVHPDDPSLPDPVRQADMALDVFEQACLGSVMHQGETAKWADENHLRPIDPSVVAGILGAAPVKSWLRLGANGAMSDVILAQPGPGQCTVVMIKADEERSTKDFLDMMAFQKANGVTLERLPDKVATGTAGTRTTIAFGSSPPNSGYGLLWMMTTTSAEGAIQLRLRSDFFRVGSATP